MTFIHTWRSAALAALLSAAVILTAAAPSKPAQEVPGSGFGAQVMPLSVDGYYALFPGDKAPFLKSGRLMVPIRAFAEIIGANMEYNEQRKFVKIRTLRGGEVGAIRAGQLGAVFDTDMGYSLGAAPEVRNGTMFVPATPILEGLKAYRTEVMLNTLNKPMLAIEERQPNGVLLSGQDPPLLPVPFPAETTANPNAFYPRMLLQSADMKSGSPQGHKLMLTVQNISGSVIPAGGAEYELIAVERTGKASTYRLTGPSKPVIKGETLALTFSIPNEAQYVLFRSRTLKPEESSGQTSRLDTERLQRIAARVMAQHDLFERFGVIPLWTQVLDGKVILTVRKPNQHRIPVPEQELESLKKAVIDMAGYPFPLELKSFVLPDEPLVTGTIRIVDAQSGHIEIDDPARKPHEGFALPEPYSARFEEDAVIYNKDLETNIPFEKLRVGQKVAVWPLISKMTEYPGQLQVLEMTVESPR